jgi:DDE domain
MGDYPPITTDKLASYPKAIRRLQDEGLPSKDIEHRTSQYLNNRIEADHRALKRLIRYLSDPSTGLVGPFPGSRNRGLESTVRYWGIDVEDGLPIAEQVEI